MKPFVANANFTGKFLVENDFLFSMLNESRMRWKVIQLPPPGTSKEPAVLETGYHIAVPLFVNQGDKIRVDTRTGEYMERI